MELVRVLWNDAQDYNDSTWASDDEAKAFGSTPCLITSVGWVVKKTKAYVTIAGDHTPNPTTWGRLMKIPRKMITEIRPLADPEGSVTLPSEPAV